VNSRAVMACGLVIALASSGCGVSDKRAPPLASLRTKVRRDPGIHRKHGRKPVVVAPFTDADGSWWLAPGKPMYAETFAYDPSRQRAFPPDGPQISSVDMPVPMRLTSFNFASYGGGASGEYANVTFDLSKISEKSHRLPLGVILVNERNKQWPAILIDNCKRILVDADYIVYPDALEAVKPGGPFATLEIVVGGSENSVNGVSVHVVKGGEELGPFSANQDGKVLINLEDLREHLVIVRMRSTSGSGEIQVPLPIRGADQRVFIQTIPFITK